MDLLHSARRLKHRLWLAQKHGAHVVTEGRDLIYRMNSTVSPARYDAARYELDFTALTGRNTSWKSDRPIPRVVWCVWSGTNAMSFNRAACLRSIREVQHDLDVRLVTPDTLHEVVVNGHPLHPSYEHLSDVHRSDYLHAYLMHHHGGAFTGIKKHHHAWAPLIEEMQEDVDAWVTGYRVPRSSEAAYFHGPLGRDVRKNFSLLLGFSGKIVRPGSPLTSEWLAEVERRLDYYGSLLAQAPGNVYGDNPGYPVPWTRIGSQVFEPLTLKYREHIRIDPRLKPQLWGHR
ncbi:MULTISPECIES: hypothetical protein [Micrococcus]|uniref:hypothetical protein n=1 Tax=Micrococcus TaxID=1269 RepID=UPI00147DA09F|nr:MULTISPECIES: hypothetical protein [Micrococcus]MCV7470682.1 hypothetical protein [Micrococcus luteus]MCV7486513.1 hypothetical protein [Micrococcus luteus]MCV7598521.1 hypothetical protein [Micrococcus luteus]NNM37503.1 hypothetical protein [Micrococcus luteus]UTT46119.1 hypothetical protein NMQ02_02505 [Micrococcus luteus]